MNIKFNNSRDIFRDFQLAKKNIFTRSYAILGNNTSSLVPKIEIFTFSSDEVNFLSVNCTKTFKHFYLNFHHERSEFQVHAEKNIPRRAFSTV